MKLYNSLTKKVEELNPQNKESVTMYTCGPTVYHYAHIGNLRTYIFEDILEKALIYNNYQVKRVMNITDVGHMANDGETGEDKLLSGAKREQKSVLEIAKFYTDAFFSDFLKLNNKKPEIISKASDNVEEYIKIISKLLESGYAYQAGNNIYFDTTKVNNYHELSGRNAEDMIIGAREDVSEDLSKRNPFDFGLWFTKSKFDNQALKWDSPWGVGYPGWHIECSGIAIKYLGETLDIHCGGVDNIFPHHTNEIAQSEAYLGHKWCNLWVHGEHLNDKEGKMSKSKGEFLTVSLLEEKGYDPLSFRYLCLGSHYQKQLMFSFEGLDIASNTYQKLKNRVLSLPNTGIIKNTDLIQDYQLKFKNSLNDNLNTANALTLIYDVLKDTNLLDYERYYLINDFDRVLSLDLTKEINHDESVLDQVKQLIDNRNQAKQNKDFAKADAIRDEIVKLGYNIKDTREGTEWFKN